LCFFLLITTDISHNDVIVKIRNDGKIPSSVDESSVSDVTEVEVEDVTGSVTRRITISVLTFPEVS
jgi:hypothetical protein